MDRMIKIREKDYNRLKVLLKELNHFVCTMDATEFVPPEKFRKPFTDEEKKLIAKYAEEGLSTYQISLKLDRKYNSVRNYLKGKRGVPEALKNNL